MSKRLLSWIVVLFLLVLPGVAFASPAAPEPPKASGLIPAAAEIGEQLQALVTGEENPEFFEPQETFGTRALGVVLDSLKLIANAGAVYLDNFAAMPQLVTWFDKQVETPTYLAMWGVIGELLILGLGFGFAFAWLADLLLIPLRRRLYDKHFTSAWSRFGAMLWWLFLALIPVATFLAVALFTVDAREPDKMTRFAVMTMIYAFTLLKTVRVAIKFAVAPRAPSLRFVPVSTPAAYYILGRVSWLSALGIFGYFLADIAKAMKVPPPAITGFLNFITLAVVVVAIAIILRKRRGISHVLRGGISVQGASGSLVGHMRLWFSRVWHVLAIGYLVVGFFVITMGDEGGFQIMQRGTIGTLLVLLAMRLGFYLEDKVGDKKKAKSPTSGLSGIVLRYLVAASIWVAGLLGLASSWGIDVEAVLMSPWGQRVLGSAFSIIATLLAVTFIYELLHRAIERHLNRKDPTGKVIESNARARTLLPMIRKSAVIILGTIVALVTMSELGVNIGPLLAGAGVLGVAVGFGSQTLVKDFLTGLFIIIEDNIAVGDYITIGSDEGTVEDLSIRTVRLRDRNGALHVIPFSEIRTIVNESKNFSFAVVDVGVAYNSDLKHVMAVLQRVSKEMRQNPEYSPDILADIEVLGVEMLGDSSITIRSRIKTKPGRRWDVRRRFLLLVKQAFDQEKIEIPFPTIMQITQPTS